jgi:hypothetical protein
VDAYPHHLYFHDHANPTLCQETLSSPTLSTSHIDAAVTPPPRKILKLATALIGATPQSQMLANPRASSTPISHRPPPPQTMTSSNASTGPNAEMQFNGEFAGCSWNSQAFFARRPAGSTRKRGTRSSF